MLGGEHVVARRDAGTAVGHHAFWRRVANGYREAFGDLLG